MITTAYINLTVLCNFTCKHCYTGIAGPTRRKELSRNDTIRMLKKISENGVKSVVLLGGEPQLRIDFLDIIYASSHLFDKVFIETNGSVLKPTLVEFIKEHELNNINFWVKKLKDNDISVGIRSTLYNEKIDYKKVISLAEIMKVPVTFVRFLPVGRGKSLNMAPNKNRLAEAYVYINKNKNVAISDCPYYVYDLKLSSRFSERFKEEGGICGARSMRRIFITEEGNCYPCMFLEEKKYCLGHILKDSWSDILNNYKKFIKELNKIKPEKSCSSCGYYDICKGGCAVYPLSTKSKSDIECPIPILEKVSEVQTCQTN